MSSNFYTRVLHVSLRYDNAGAPIYGLLGLINEGSLLATRTRFVDFSYSVLLAELEAIVRSLSLETGLGLSRVIIESNAKGQLIFFAI